MCHFYSALMAVFLSTIAWPMACHAQFDHVLNIPPDVLPESIQDNTQINLFDEGSIPPGYTGTSHLNDNVEINIFGGNVGKDATLIVDQITVTGGTIANGVQLYAADSLVSDGFFGDDCRIGLNWPASSGTITGGTFGRNLKLSCNCFIEGGTFDNDLKLSRRVVLNDGLTKNIELEQGISYLQLNGGTVNGDIAGTGHLELNDATISGNVSLAGNYWRSRVDLNSGTVHGVSCTSTMQINSVEVRATTILGSAAAVGPSTLRFFGGDVVDDVACSSESEVNIAGGKFLGNFVISPDATLLLQGTDFRLVDSKSGHLIKDLTPELEQLSDFETFEVPQRDVSIVGTLSDGTKIQIELNSVEKDGRDFVSSQASLQIAKPFPNAFYGFIAPRIAITFRGFEFETNDLLNDVAESDDVHARYHPGFTLGNDHPVWLIFSGIAPSQTMRQSLQFAVESNAGTPGISKFVDFYDWENRNYHFCEVELENYNIDTVTFVEVPLDDQDKRFVDVHGQVRARVGWRRTGFTITQPWEIRVDHVFWIAN